MRRRLYIILTMGVLLILALATAVTLIIPYIARMHSYRGCMTIKGRNS